jgi:hypothetical protein
MVEGSQTLPPAADSGDAQGISPDRERVGKLLYRFAWVIEVFAVSIGLGIAVMQLATSFTELNNGKDGALGFGDWTNIIIAAIPFLMVAAVEITKIPFTDAFYKTTHRVWKVVFLISLIIISGITFESALNGFERNFNALNIGVTKLQKQLLVTEESMVPLQDRIDRAAALTIEKVEGEYTDRYTQLSAQRAEQTSVVDDRKAQLRASIQSEYTEGLQNQLSVLREEVTTVRKEQRDALSDHRERFTVESDSAANVQKSKLRGLAQEAKREEDSLDAIRSAGAKAIAGANLFNATSTRERVEKEVADQQKRVDAARERLDIARNGDGNNTRAELYRQEQSQIRDDYDQRLIILQEEIKSLTNTYNQSIGTREKDVASTLATYDTELLAIEEKFSGQFREIKQLRDNQLTILENNTTLIAGWEGDLDDLQERKVALREDINTAVGDNQIYRMAQLFSGAESSADIPKNYIVNVAVTWFASLAGMVAFTGVILAMASNVIRDPRLPNYRSKNDRPVRDMAYRTVRSFRRWVLYRRRLDRKPIIRERVKEVTKEVPVDRVVKHEVPIQTIQKEIVHVPFYTNDPKLLKMGVEKEAQLNPSDDESRDGES